MLTRPDSDEVLKSFCRRVQPWGFWGPVQKMLAAEDPSYQPNRTFTRDMFNCAVGIVWQIALSVMPVFLVIREMTGFWISLLVVAITTTILKFNWYDKLPSAESD